MTTRFTKLFDSLSDRIAFIPFLMCGDPDFDKSLKHIRSAIEAGADALELGIPFSDPIADGPVIQAAANRALAAGATINSSFELIKSIRSDYPEIPIGLLVYANLIYSYGIDDFYSAAFAAGVDSVLIPDLPLEEADYFHQSALSKNVSPIYICPQNADDELIKRIAQYSRDYVYVVSRDGVTGADSEIRLSNKSNVVKLKAAGCQNPVIGFGISKPEHVKQAKLAGFSGAICGSAIIKLIAKGVNPAPLIRELMT